MNENYVVIENYWLNVSQAEKDAAIGNGQYIICNEIDPKYPLMSYAVYDPSLQCPDNLLAIFRKIDSAKIFINVAR